MRLVTLLALVSLAPISLAQETGDCAEGTAHVILDGSDVRASVYNTGRLFYDARTEADDPPHFEVPKGSGVDAMFLSSLWVGGTPNGEQGAARMAATTYGGADFWPGPLTASGGVPTSSDCASADHIWHVTLEDIARYNDTGVATADLDDWPVHLGAPVVDGDGIDGNYDLAAGDRPAILGDETAWWILNDGGNAHEWSGTLPMGVEVRVTAFTVSESYGRVRLELGETASHTQRMVFVRYEIRYLRDQPLVNVYLGVHLDPDIGDPMDDYVGTYPDSGLLFGYNRDPMDNRYGTSPPAAGVQILHGPAGRPLSGSFDLSSGTGPTGTPGLPPRHVIAYRNLMGLFFDGVPLTFGGDGYNPGSTQRTPHVYPGLPPGYWSQMNLDGSGSEPRYPSGDARILGSHGPFTMEPGGTYTLDTAYLWARSDLGPVESVYRLVQEAAPAALTVPFTPDPDLATLRLGDLPEALPTVGTPITPPQANTLAASASPTPTTGLTRIPFDLAAEAAVRLEVFDALGRRVAVPVDGVLGPGEYRPEVDVSGWAAGVYVYRLTLGGRPAGSGRLVVAR